MTQFQPDEIAYVMRWLEGERGKLPQDWHRNHFDMSAHYEPDVRMRVRLSLLPNDRREWLTEALAKRRVQLNEWDASGYASVVA